VKIIHPIQTGESYAFARNAMATRFEIVLPGGDELCLRAMAEEAFNEVERLESLLSPFRPTSEIAHLNARAAQEPVRVSPETFGLLKHAAQLSEETDRAFDITVGALMRAWGFFKGPGHLPDAQTLAAAREYVGMGLLQFDEPEQQIRFTRPGVQIDLGAIGKGYAVGRAADMLREMGVASALIHGGTSTIYAIGHPLDASGWKIAIKDLPACNTNNAPPLATVELCDTALSMSADWGRCFEAGGIQYGHVLDPRTGAPGRRARLAVVIGGSALETDAFSTALLAQGADGIGALGAVRPEMKLLLVTAEGDWYAHQVFHRQKIE